VFVAITNWVVTALRLITEAKEAAATISAAAEGVTFVWNWAVPVGEFDPVKTVLPTVTVSPAATRENVTEEVEETALPA
jgi:hypothetical protein